MWERFQCFFFSSAIAFLEALACIKFGQDLFSKTQVLYVILWLLCVVRFRFILLFTRLYQARRQGCHIGPDFPPNPATLAAVSCQIGLEILSNLATLPVGLKGLVRHFNHDSSTINIEVIFLLVRANMSHLFSIMYLFSGLYYIPVPLWNGVVC